MVIEKFKIKENFKTNLLTVFGWVLLGFTAAPIYLTFSLHRDFALVVLFFIVSSIIILDLRKKTSKANKYVKFFINVSQDLLNNGMEYNEMEDLSDEVTTFIRMNHLSTINELKMTALQQDIFHRQHLKK